MALGVVLVTLGGYFEGSTLFFLAAASFLAGAVWRNISLTASVSFIAGTTLLGVFLAPQKLYLATFFAFCIYILAAEYFEQRRERKPLYAAGAVWAVKAVLYHGLLAVFLVATKIFFGFENLFSGRIFAILGKNIWILAIVLLVAAEAFWLLFDRAYVFFQNRYGNFFRLRE